jgi:hypothetical protein
VCADAAGLSYQVTDGGGACQEVQIPGWTKPDEPDRCQYDFRSPREGVVYLGLSCNAVVSWSRSPQKYALIPLRGKTTDRISQAQWDAAPLLWTSEQGYRGYGGPTDSVAYAEYKSKRFPRSGLRWPLATSGELVSPGQARIAIFGWDGVIEYPTGEGIFGVNAAFGGRYKGKYSIDIYDVASTARLIHIQGDFRGFDPFNDARASLFLTGRYYQFSLDGEKHKKMLVCDIDAAARMKGAVAEDPPRRFALNGSITYRDIKEETPKARVLSVRDDPVTDPNTGLIVAVDVTAFLDVSAPGKYKLRIQLGAPADGRSAQLFPDREIEASLEPGLRKMIVRFPVAVLRGLKPDGPWNFNLIILTHPIPEGRGVDYMRFDAGKTQSYKLGATIPQ